jgi:hypothetical protein
MLKDPTVFVDTGNGGFYAETWTELMSAIFEVIVYAMHFKKHGKCICDCTIAECAYCAHECFWRPVLF